MWRDRDPNDISADCFFISYFLDFKFSKYVCPSELHLLIWFLFNNLFRKKKKIRKATQNALAPNIFIVLSIALRLKHRFNKPKRRKQCHRIFNFAPEVEIWTKNLPRHCIRPCAFFRCFSSLFFHQTYAGARKKTKCPKKKKHWLSVPDYLTDKGNTELVLSAVILLLISLPNNDRVKPVATEVWLSLY